MTLRVVVADDEPPARERLRELLAGVPDVQVVGEAPSGTAAVEAVRRLQPDLLLLDVQMPGLDGFGVLEALEPGELPAVVFVTAYDAYALRAFEVHALDYLLKPFDAERLGRALDRVRAARAAEAAAAPDPRLLELLSRLAERRTPFERLLAKRGDTSVLLRCAELDWIEAAGNYLRLHVGREIFLVRETLSSLEGRLDPARFARVHRSIMVNLDRVREIHPAFHGDAVLRLADGTDVPLSRTYRDALEARLGRTL